MNQRGRPPKDKTEEDQEMGITEERISSLENRIKALEDRNKYAVNNQFEIWFDNKVRGFEYGPDLKKIVMPQTVGKSLEESRKIFFTERDKMCREKYPGRPTPGWI